MAKGKANVQTTKVLPLRSKRDADDTYVRSRPSHLDDGTVSIDAESFCGAAELVRQADGKKLPSY